MRALLQIILGGLLGMAPRAWAGEVDGEAGVYVLGATNTSSEAGAGDPERMSSFDLGFRARLGLRNDSDRIGFDLDYRGRQPVGGDVRNSSLHLVYRAEARFEVVEDRLTLGVGRFLAPSAVFLPVDGVKAEVQIGKGWRAGAFFGRRGITTSRYNVALNDFLPAAGASFGFVHPRLVLDGNVTYAQDLLRLDGDDRFAAWNGAVRATVLPTDKWRVGAWFAFVQRATYLLGPTWADQQVDVESVGMHNAAAWARFTPTKAWALDYYFQAQKMDVVRGPSTTPDTVLNPSFVDNRLHVAVAPLDRGWLRFMVRHRLRNDRQEIRWGGRLDANDLGLPGAFVRGRVYVDHLFDSADPAFAPAFDRLFWSGSVGYHDFGLDLEVGASSVERAANPVSSRKGDPAQPDLPTQSDDLALFVLEAERIVFLRAFYSARRWYGGLDFEQSLDDAEFRIMAQVGVLGAKSW